MCSIFSGLLFITIFSKWQWYCLLIIILWIIIKNIRLSYSPYWICTWYGLIIIISFWKTYCYRVLSIRLRLYSKINYYNSHLVDKLDPDDEYCLYLSIIISSFIQSNLYYLFNIPGLLKFLITLIVY